MLSRLTAAIEGSASPRNPKVRTLARSEDDEILLVAWRSRLSSASSRPIPIPSSLTRISPFPPRNRETSIREARASREFSTNSLTIDAGLSTTSPAAI